MVIGYFTFCWYMPEIFGGERHPDCLMRAGYANAMFGWCIIGPTALLHLGFIVGFFIKKRTNHSVAALQEYVRVASIVVAIGLAIL